MNSVPTIRRAAAAALLPILLLAGGAGAAGAPAPRLIPAVEKSAFDLPAAPARADRTAAGTAARGPRPDGNPTIPLADDFLIFSNRFQELDGACNERGWSFEDRTARVYGHVDTRTSNSAFLSSETAAGTSIASGVPLGTNPIHFNGVVAAQGTGTVYWVDRAFDSDAFRFDTGANTVTAHGPRPGPGSTVEAAVVRADGSLVAADLNFLYLYPGGGAAPVAIAGNPAGSPDDTLAAQARLSLTATQLAADAAGNVWFAEPGTGRVRMLRASDGRVVTMVGTGGTLNSQALFAPYGLAFDFGAGHLYVPDRSAFKVYRYDLGTGARTVYADGDGDNIPSFEKAAVANGQLYATALGSGALYRVNPGVYPDPIAEVVIGNGRLIATPAQRQDASVFATSLIADLSPDGAGGILFTCAKSLVLRYEPATGTLTRVAGVPISMDMGTRAFWIGADLGSAPDEVARWVSSHGYGNSWGQWLESPPIPLAGAADPTVSFDLQMELDETFANEYVAALAQDASGAWRHVQIRFVVPTPQAPTAQNGPFSTPKWLMQRGIVPCEIHLLAPENAGIALGATTRVRLYLRTNAIYSSEDGGGSWEAGGAIFDNLRVRDGGTDLIPLVDFEDGTLGGWTPGARNFAFDNPFNTDFLERPAAGTDVQLRDGYDSANTSCVWTFLSPGDSLGPGVLTRLTSPWIRRYAPNAPLFVYFSGKLPTAAQKRFLTVTVRGKNVGDVRPRLHSPSFFIYNSGTPGGDVNSPYVNRREISSVVDLQVPPVADSVQLVFEIQERERTLITGLPFSRLPYLDDFEVAELAVDRDYDGIADAVDACPDECAAGQDADGDGCLDPTSTMRHVESWRSSLATVRFVPSLPGLPGVTDGSDLQAIRAAAAAWRDVPGATNRLVEALPSSQLAASAMDGVNLVTFRDPNLEFPPSVLAVTPTLSFNRTTNYGDRVVPPGEIVDADVVVNGAASLGTPTFAGSFDLQGVMTHEFGHMLGLVHSGVKDATMYFVQLPAQDARSLESDDRSALAAAYPAPALFTDFATIGGRVLRDTTGGGLPGALVTAVRLDAAGAPMDTVASDYTDESGRYRIHRLPPGDYGIHIQALDGSVLDGLVPAFVSERLAASADVSFDAEWYTAGDTYDDDPAVKTVIAVAAGEQFLTADLVSNLDTSAPFVVSLNPAGAATGVGVDATILVNFSEPVDATSLQAAFALRETGSSTRLAGSGILSGFGRTFVFTPEVALRFETDYELTISTALADGNGVHPAADFVSGFRTQARPSVSIADVQPRSVLAGGTLTVIGQGFDAVSPFNNLLSLSAPAYNDTAVVGFVTPTSMVAVLPPGVPPGPLTLQAVRGPATETSNTFLVTVVPPAPQASPIPSGAAIPVPFVPRDVALSSDGTMAYVVGDGGFATINLDPARAAAQPALHPLRVAVPRLAGDHARVVLSTDGARAYVSVPNASSLLEVDALPSSATFGALRDSVPVTGSPQGLAVAPNGKRLWYTDQSAAQAGEVNVDPASAGYLQPVRMLGLIHPPNGGITASDAGQALYVTSAVSVVRVDLATANVTPVAVGFLRPGAVGDLANRRFYFASGSAGVKRVTVPGATINLPTGGSVADVARSPIGPSIFAVNDGTNRLQVVNADSANANFGTVVAEVATGSAPSALAVNANGGTIAVANAGDRTVQIYGYGAAGTPAARRVMPPAAVPGQMAAVHGDATTSGFAPGTLVDLGSGSPFPALNPTGDAAGFRVPVMPAQATSVVLQRPDAQRTLGLPFQIVEPIPVAIPRPGGITLPARTSPCFFPIVGAVKFIRLTPDGRRLVAVRQTTCSVSADAYAIEDDGITPLGSALLTGPVIGGSDVADDAAITPDGRFLWVASGELGAAIFDIDPASPTAGTRVGTVGVTTLGNPRGLLADPLGRFMICGTHAGSGPFSNGASLWPVTGVDAPIAEIPGANGYSFAASGDGRYLVGGSVQQATFSDLNARTLLATTPARGAVGSIYVSVAVSRDGRRAIGLLNSPTLGTGTQVTLWNLDPAAGAIGFELFHGLVPGAEGSRLDYVIPAADAGGFFASQADGDLLMRLTPLGGGLIGAQVPLPFPTTSIAFTPDGRRMWLTRNAGPSGSITDGDFQMFDMSRAGALSLVAGAGQSGLPSTVLPVPVRVRVTHGGGAPEPGVLVQFDLAAGQGTFAGTAGRTRVTRVSDANGEAEARWQLPPGVLGGVTMTATALGVASTSVTATVVADDASIVPELVELGPADGATGINAGTQLFARFNQRMQATVANAITVRVNGSAVSAVKSFSDGGRFVLVTPSAPLPFGATGQIEVAAGALDTDGQTLAAGGQATFTVQDAPALALSSLSPPSGPVGASVAINGAGFSPTPALNTVRINGALAQVTSATLNALVCRVPATATTGPLTVEVGGITSAPLSFVVLTGTGVGGALGDLSASGGIRDIAVTPDGTRVYVTNPSLNTVSALQVADALGLGSVTVGLQPQGIAITPDGARAYVANTGSNDVSVIVTDPAGPGYNAELRKIAVGPSPVDVAISGTSKVVVVNSGDGTLSVIDGNPANLATYDRVTATVNCGSAAQAVAISADGTRAYVATGAGLAIVDLLAGAVTTTVNCGSAAQAVAISADNTLALVLTALGELRVINLAPGTAQYQVVTSVNCGSSAQAVAVSADGTRAFVSLSDGATVLVFEIRFANGAQASSVVPGPAIRLVPAPSIAVGQGPAGIAVDVSGVPRVYVANSVSGTVTVIGFPNFLPTLPVDFRFSPRSLNLKSMGRWVKGVLEPHPPALASDILLASIRLNGVVAVDSSGPHGVGDDDGDGIPDLTVRFRRAEVEAVVPEGDDVPVTVTGLLGGRNFEGTDAIKVKRGQVTAPAPHATLAPGDDFTVRWTTPNGVNALWVRIAHSLDGGATWTTDADGIPNSGAYVWSVPMVAAESAMVAVAIVEQEGGLTGGGTNPEITPGMENLESVEGVLARSGVFRIFGATDVAAAPATFEFVPILPNPARAVARLRFGLPQRTHVALEVFDLQGRRVRTLARGTLAAGWHEREWNGRGDGGDPADAGLYFVRLKAAGREWNRRLVWLR